VALDGELVSARAVEAQILESLGRYEEALAIVNDLAAAETGGAGEHSVWAERLRNDLAEAELSRQSGKMRLLHIVVADSSTAQRVSEELATGEDFAAVAMRFSVGPTAVRGGDVGWMAADELVEPLRSAVGALAPQTTTTVIESRGYYHVFKRLH
jgi:peptidyl-prolyl cis-trans isomerase C